MPSQAASTKTLPAEHTLRMRHAKLVQMAGTALRADRDVQEAAKRQAQARADLAEEIAANMPLLTDDQIRKLRPIFAGTLDVRAETSAA